MQNMQYFIVWFLDHIPEFLMSEPIVYLFGFVLLAFTVKIIFRIMRI